jgi:hypothetical protein
MQSYLENLGLQALSDLLINKTKELLQLIETKNADGIAIHDLHKEIAEIREAIKSRKPDIFNFDILYN